MAGTRQFLSRNVEFPLRVLKPPENTCSKGMFQGAKMMGGWWSWHIQLLVVLILVGNGDPFFGYLTFYCTPEAVIFRATELANWRKINFQLLSCPWCQFIHASEDFLHLTFSKEIGMYQLRTVLEWKMSQFYRTALKKVPHIVDPYRMEITLKYMRYVVEKRVWMY